MALFPEAESLEGSLDGARSESWEQLLAVREEVLKALEQSRTAKEISAALEARVTLGANGDLGNLLQKYGAMLPALFIVSQVQWAPRIDDGLDAPGIAGLKIRVEKAAGQKCPRCWNYSTHIGESAAYPTVCERCAAALGEMGWVNGPETVKV
jgi:isoleucyl-tRNA synthetase